MLGNLFGKRTKAGAATEENAGRSGPYRPENLTLRIKHSNFIKTLQAHGVPPQQMPVTRPLCGELIVSYAFDMPEQFVMATPPLLAQAEVDPQDLDALVQTNFKGAFSAQLLKAGQEGLMRVRTGRDLEAVMLVFDGFWSSHVKNHVQGDIVVTVPRRDVILIADTAVPGALDALRKNTELAFHQGDDNHALSPQMMKWAGHGWELHATRSSEVA